MAFSIVGTPQTSAGSGVTQSVTKPTGVASGDFLLLFVQTETATASPTTPTGFTLIGEKASTLQSFRVTAYRRVADGTEGASFSVTGGSGTSWMELALIAVRGGDTTSPYDVSSNNANVTSGTTVTFLGITTTAADFLVAFAADWTGIPTFTVPTGYTSQLADTVDGLFIATTTQTASGATGNVTGTLSGSDAWITWFIGIKPPGGGTVSSGVVNMGSGPDGLLLTTIYAGLVDVGTSSGGGEHLGNPPVGNTASDGLSVVSDALGSATVGNQVAPAGGLSAPRSVALSNITPLGATGGGLSAVSRALASAAVMGGAGQLALITIPPPITMGSSGGGLVVFGGIFILAPKIRMGSFVLPAGGIANFFGTIGYPNGHWAELAVLIWRETSPGSHVFAWKPVRFAVWRGPGPGWKQLIT